MTKQRWILGLVLLMAIGAVAFSVGKADAQGPFVFGEACGKVCTESGGVWQCKPPEWWEPTDRCCIYLMSGDPGCGESTLDDCESCTTGTSGF